MVYILSFFLCKSTLWIYRRLRDNPNVEGIGVCMRTCYEMHKNWSAVGKECEGYPLGSSLHIWWGKVQIPFMKMDRKYMGKKMEIVNQTHQLALILYASTVTNLHNPHPTIPFFSIWKISGSSFLDKYKSRPIMTWAHLENSNLKPAAEYHLLPTAELRPASSKCASIK